MKKHITVAIMALGIAGIMATGCGFSSSSSFTKTETVTNSDGTTTTTTTTKSSEKTGMGRSSHSETEETVTKDADGTIISESSTSDSTGTSDYKNVNLKVENDLDFDIAELYIYDAAEDDFWADNLLEDNVLPEGYETIGLTISYSADNSLVNVKVVDEYGEDLIFENVDLMDAEDPTDICMDLLYDADADAYTLEIM